MHNVIFWASQHRGGRYSNIHVRGGRWKNDGEGRELLRHSVCIISSFGLQPNDP